MTENTPRVSPPRVPFWARFGIVVLAIAAACLGLVILHSTDSHQLAHSHNGVSGAHSHSDMTTSGTTTLADAEETDGTPGFLATCEGCALGTVAGATGVGLLLLLLVAAFVLMQNPAVLARLIKRGRTTSGPIATLPRCLTPPPLVLGISRT